MLEWLRDRLIPPGEETIPVDEALERFRAEKEKDLQRVAARADTLREEVLDGIATIEDGLQKLEGFEHEHTRVADVADNVATERLRHIDNFTAPTDIAAFHTAADSLVSELGAVTKKEKAVLDYVGSDVAAVFKNIKTVEDRVNRVEQFLENEYTIAQDNETLAELVDRWHEMQETATGLQKQLASFDISALREEAAAVDAKLDELQDDPEQKEKEKIEADINELKQKRDAKQREVAAAASNMERGLKKLLYAARNDDLELSREHLTVLEKIKNGSVAQEFTVPAADVAAAVDAAAAAVVEVDLGERQRDKFQDGAETLKDLDDIRDELEAVTTEIEEKEDELDQLTIDDRRNELETKRNQIQNRIQARTEVRQQVQEQLEANEAERRKLRDRIEAILDTHFRADITIEPA